MEDIFLLAGFLHLYTNPDQWSRLAYLDQSIPVSGHRYTAYLWAAHLLGRPGIGAVGCSDGPGRSCIGEGIKKAFRPSLPNNFGVMPSVYLGDFILNRIADPLN